jgi:oligopeptide transport system ATP-binding protein
VPDSCIEVADLKKYYPAERGGDAVKAVDGVTFAIGKGETFGLVGESGCGKSTTGRCILRLVEPTSGGVYFEGHALTEVSSKQLRALRRDMQVIFQDPYSSLNPRMTVGQIVDEPLLIHRVAGPDVRRKRVAELLNLVGLKPENARRYPHEFSGGQRQRIGIARALALNPKFIVCDEPVSALDVSVQAQIVNLLQDLQEQLGLTYLFISHGLAVVEHISNRVGIMYRGKIVELAPTAEIFNSPLHPYTNALLAAILEPDPDSAREQPERVPNCIDSQGNDPLSANGSPDGGATAPGGGCSFRDRCPLAAPICAEREPELVETSPGHHVSCFVVAPALKR